MPLFPITAEKNPAVVILVVENQADVRNKIVTDLAGQWSLRVAATAAEAEILLEQEPVQLVLLGLPMGSIEGGRILQCVKRIDEHIEIVVLAAFETKESARQAIRQGACDYISKTAEPNILREAVARAVRLRDLFDREASNHVRLSNLTQQLNDTVIREEIARNNNLGYAGVLHDMEQVHAGLLAMAGKIGQSLRENDWLMAIKQRTSIPGGACEFDLPSYHHWLHRDSAVRYRDLEGWLSPLFPIRDATGIVLRMLRESGKPVDVVAIGGSLQQMLGGRSAQMVRIRIPRALDYIPEISANKYMLNVRFVTLADARSRPVESDVGFQLTFCAL